MSHDKIEQLWKLAYASFNRPHEALENPGIVGITTSSHVVGSRLLDAVSKLRNGQQEADLFSGIEADVRLGMSMGWITPDKGDEMLDLIAEISDGV